MKSRHLIWLQLAILYSFVHYMLYAFHKGMDDNKVSRDLRGWMKPDSALFHARHEVKHVPRRRIDSINTDEAQGQILRWAIVTPPKPFKQNSYQIHAIRSWQMLRTPPQIYLVRSGDTDKNELAEIEGDLGVRSIDCALNAHGLPLQNSMFETASMIKDVDVVVVINTDIILENNFVDALELVEGYFDRFLFVGARYDSFSSEKSPAFNISNSEARQWPARLRELARQNGALHTYGGSDYFAWRPVGDPATAAIGSRIPPFTYARGKADNWIVKTAIQNGIVEVVDASTAVFAVHIKHDYHLGNESVEGAAATDSSSYQNYWSSKSAGDSEVDFNKHLAYTFGSFTNGQGTPLEAPWVLNRCVDISAPHTAGLQQGLCMRYRQRPGACPCEGHAFVPSTLTEIEVGERQTVCAHSPLSRSESFDEDFTFQMLLSQQAKDDTLILFGFNNGYQGMLLNMLCRLHSLKITNYVVAAFDPAAYTFCKKYGLPCFPISTEVASPPSDTKSNASIAHDFGTAAFRALTKLKSQQVLRILELGYSVLWSDVDIFWKRNPLPQLLSSMGGAHIAIQSNAPPAEAAANGMRRINSGFYLARHSDTTMAAFRQIVAHAQSTTLSEQPSFYTVLCGDKQEHTVDHTTCINSHLNVTTAFLDRNIFPNGAMETILKSVTPTSNDEVAIVHFNWRLGHDIKVESFKNATMWLLDENLNCVAEM